MLSSGERNCVNLQNSPGRISTKAQPALSESRTRASPPSTRKQRMQPAKTKLSTPRVRSREGSMNRPKYNKEPSRCRDIGISNTPRPSTTEPKLQRHPTQTAFSMISMVESKVRPKSHVQSGEGNIRLSMGHVPDPNNPGP